jgi:hypothetical protein
MTAARPVVARLGACVAPIGMATMVGGTFLPWLRSGVALRNSYQAIDALRPLLGDRADGVGAVFTVWFGVIPAAAVCVALYAVGLRRLSGVGAMLVSAVVGTAAGAAAVQGHDATSLIAVADTGPVVTLAGAALALFGALAVVIGPRRGPAGHTATVGGSS